MTHLLWLLCFRFRLNIIDISTQIWMSCLPDCVNKVQSAKQTILLQTLSYGNKVTVMSIIWRGEICQLTHWGRVTHICVSDLTSIGSDNGLSPGRRQAIIRTNAGILLIRPLGTNFSEFLVAILIFSLKKMRLKVSSVKGRPFCLGLNELRTLFDTLHEWLPCSFIAQSVFGLPLIRLSEQPTTGYIVAVAVFLR